MSRRPSSRRARKPNSESPVSRDLILAGSADSRLTKAQRTFNRLVRQIEKLQRDIARENTRLDDLVSVFATQVYPMEQEIARLRMQILLKLDTHYSQAPRRSGGSRNRFLKMLKEQLLEQMAELNGHLDDTFETLFQKIMKCTPDEYKSRVARKAQEEIEREFEEMDLDIDLSGLTPDADPESILRTLDEINRKLGDRAAGGNPKETPAAEVQHPAEDERQRLAEEMRTKDLSSLYKQLAKLLHPDLEQDPERRALKEAAMKQLNAAHASRDLHAMLKLEIEWITQEGTNASDLSDQKLAIYNTVLQEQVGELQQMLERVWMHPRFMPLAKFAHPYFGLSFISSFDLKSRVAGDLSIFRRCSEILSGEPSPEELHWLTKQLGPAKRDPGEGLFGF